MAAPGSNVGSIKMSDKPPYRKWGGVVLGFLLTGSAHFISGQHAAGLRWYFGILACALLALLIIGAVPGMLAYIVGVILFLVSIVLWVSMLKQSYRPVPRIGFLGWIAVIVINFALNYAWIYALRTVVRPFRISTGGMSPTLQRGDHVYVEKISVAFAKLERGDIIVFRTTGLPRFQ